jgi:hypothetical protein
MGYRDAIRQIAKDLEEIKEDIHERSQALESIAEKVNELEEENKNLKK